MVNEPSKTSTGLSPAKRELLARLLKQKGVGAPQAEMIPRRSRPEDPCVLSFAQERVWFFEQLEPGTAVYNVPAAVRLKGQLDTTALERSLNEIVRRHESLRTIFLNVEGTPMQAVAPAQPLTLTSIDLRHLPPGERDARARQLAAEEARKPFDLTSGRLLRASLVQLDDDEHVALLTMQHITSDGWSTKVLVTELSKLYAAYSTGKPSPLNELPIQYADFAVWQRGWLKGEVLEEHLTYWKRQLDGLTTLQLRTDRPRPLVHSFRGERETIYVSNVLTEQVKALSAREGASFFMTLLAAWQTLMARYTWQEEIVVGTPIANRTRGEIEGIIGFFVNTLVLRTKLEGNPRFVDFLGHVKEVTLGAYAHQSLPFEYLVDELAPERDLGRHPLFQVFFALNNNPSEPFELPGLTLKGFAGAGVLSKFDLEMSLVEVDDRLKCTLIYNPDLFDSSTIIRILEHYEMLLQAVVEQPLCRLLDLPFGSDEHENEATVFENADEFVFDF
ncbi:MAG TPA: condensation domain-containing protein [Pyrinomonadaceae bacterium]